MKEHKVPVQSLIDHIKTAVDVDPWAKEMVEELLKEQEPIKPKSKVRHGENGQIQHWCGNCMAMLHGKQNYCSNYGRQVKWE